MDVARTPPGTDLRALIGGAQKVAVIDVETTGLSQPDRVVEVAIVTLDATGRVIDEFDCLVDPQRDVGPTRIHRITPSMLHDAPVFADIAPQVAALLDGAVVAAHNLPFDTGMLGRELAAAGLEIEWGRGLDTLAATGCRLGDACAEFGIRLDGAHRALADARATAQLLLRVIPDLEPPCVAATVWPPTTAAPVRLRTRDGVVFRSEPSCAGPAHGARSAPDIAPYFALLDRAVADLEITEAQRAELASCAAASALDDRQVAAAHRAFVNGLIDSALRDPIVTDERFGALCRAAALLEVDVELVARRTHPYRSAGEVLVLSAGLEVCFTGEAVTAEGRVIERSDIVTLAERHGLVPKQSVTARGCGLLVAADIATQSRKAGNARRYGIPITGYPEFLHAIGSQAPLRVARSRPSGVALVCRACGDSWMAARRAATPVCAACKARPSSTARRA